MKEVVGLLIFLAGLVVLSMAVAHQYQEYVRRDTACYMIGEETVCGKL